MDQDGNNLEMYINIHGNIVVKIYRDDYEWELTSMGLSDAIEMYAELGKLIAEMESNG